MLRIVSTDFRALRLFCFSIRQHGRQILYLNYMWTAANFIIEGGKGRTAVSCAPLAYNKARPFNRESYSI